MLSFNDALALNKASVHIANYPNNKKRGNIYEVWLLFEDSTDNIKLLNLLVDGNSWEVEDFYSKWRYLENFFFWSFNVHFSGSSLTDYTEDHHKGLITQAVNGSLLEIFDMFFKEFIQSQLSNLMSKTDQTLMTLVDNYDLQESFSSFTFFKDEFSSKMKEIRDDFLVQVEKIQGYYDVIYYAIETYKSLKSQEYLLDSEEFKKQVEENEELIKSLKKIMQGFDSISLKEFLSMEQSKVRKVMLIFTELSTGKAITDTKVLE